MNNIVTEEMLLERALIHMEESYDLIYIDRSDELSEEDLTQYIFHQDDFWGGQFMEEFGEARSEGMEYAVDTLRDAVYRSIQIEDEQWFMENEETLGNLWYEITHLIEDNIVNRESSEWFSELLANSLRNAPWMSSRIDLDDVLYEELSDEKVREILATFGVTATDEDIEQLVAECSYPDWWAAKVVFIPDSVGAIEALSSFSGEDRVVVTDPHLWVGNPMMGNGFEIPLEGDVCIKTGDLSPETMFEEVFAPRRGEYVSKVSCVL